MIRPGSIAAVFRFEMKRAATVPRMAWWVVLALFPILLTLMVQKITDMVGEPEQTRVVRFEATALSGSGLPTLESDGKKVKGRKAISLIRSEGHSRMKDLVGAQLRGLGFDPARQDQEERGKGRRRRPSPQRLPPQPILILQHPGDIEEGDERLTRLDRRINDSFSKIAYYPAGEEEPDVVPPSAQLLLWGFGLFVLLPAVVSMLGVFLWATPAVSSELEGRSWAYLATRPDGPVSVLLGKYLVGVLWGISAALVSLVGCLLIAKVPEGSWQLFLPLATLIVLGCPAFGAIYALIGTILPRRAMVIAVVYSLTFEGFVSFLPALLGAPALISRVTILYPLRALLTKWLRLDRITESDFNNLLVADSSDFVDVGSVILITIFALGAAVMVLRVQEHSAADESES